MDRLSTHIRRMKDLVARRQVPWLGQFASVAGEPVHWVEGGTGNPVLLLHGLLAWSFTWRWNLTAMTSGFRAIAPDFPGFGLSAKPLQGRFDLDAQADWVCRFMDLAGVRQVVVVGHSMGGEIAIRLAIRHPERVSGLLLVCSAGLVTKRMPLLARLAMRFPDLCAPIVGPLWANPRFARRVLSIAYHDPERVTEAAVAGYSLPALSPGVSRVLPRVLAQADFGTCAGIIDKVACPVLLVWGRSDPFVPLHFGQRMHEQLAGSRLEVFEASGHLPHEEEPERFNALAGRWLAGSH